MVWFMFEAWDGHIGHSIQSLFKDQRNSSKFPENDVANTRYDFY